VTKEGPGAFKARRPGGGKDPIAMTYGSADFHNGVRAFLEKRKPRWTGR
jgi:enoyl-CoA hydratase